MKTSVNNRNWKLVKCNDAKIHELVTKQGISELSAKLMINRGVIQDLAADYISPKIKNLLINPYSLLDMSKALDRVSKAIETNEKVAIFSDYDVDGATSSSIIRHYFHFLKKDIELYIPDRMLEGYGPNSLAMDSLKEKGISLVLMLDCGTNAFVPLKHAKDIGLDIIVLDHHLPEETLPELYALINPNRRDQDLNGRTDLSGLCTAGVAFIFLVGLQSLLIKKIIITEKFNLLELLDIVALGTVCDVMPLKGLNRAFVTQGLKIAQNSKWPGLLSLARVAKLDIIDSAYHFGFVLGPRINAGGRVGKSNLGSNLLSSLDTVEANNFAQQLESYNQERVEIEKRSLDEAIKLAEEQKDLPIIIVAGDWHQGVIGIIASRIKERFSRPALVISTSESESEAKGSGRSTTCLDLGHLIHEANAAGHITKGGGHKAAVGFSLDKSKIKYFHEFLILKLKNHTFDNSMKVDDILTLGQLDEQFFKDISLLEPFGMGNPTPKFMIENVEIKESSIIKDQHIRFVLADGSGKTCKGIIFRALNTDLGKQLLHNKGKVSVIGTVKQNTWRGVISPNFIIEDMIC